MASGSAAIEEIKERLSIVDVVSTKVQLKKAGRTLKGLCPFHNEKTPSFIVFPDKGNYHCFGCGQNGDIFTFVMKTENLDFTAALETLAQRAGVTLKPRQAAAKEDKRRARIFELNALAADYYHQLLRRDVGRVAWDYLQRRGITEETAEVYALGWAPDSYDALQHYLASRGATEAEMLEAGLAVEREERGPRDTFRARVTFPIRDEKGNTLGFGGRTLADVQPKYLNTPGTPVFDKGGCLYGLDAGRQAIRQAGHAVIVEGYTDVLIAHQYGFKNVLASLGTALTDRQVAVLKRHTKHVVLALDPDAAGEAAVLRGAEVVRRGFGAAVPVPLPNGLIRLEQHLDAEINIAALPAGEDPDEVIRRDPAEWRRLIESAKPIVDFYFDTVLRKADLTTAKGSSEAVQQLLPIVGELRDQVQRAFHLRRLAAAVGVSEQVIESEARRLRLREGESRLPEPRRHTELVRAQARPGSVLDGYYVELALEHFRRTGRLPSEIDEDTFGTTEGREAFAWLRSRASAGALDIQNMSDILQTELPEPLAEWLAERVRGAHGVQLLYEAEFARELERTTREIRRRNLRWRSEELAELMRQAADESSIPEDRDYVEAAEALLTQLQPYEIHSTRSAVWRRSPSAGDNQEQRAGPAGDA